MSYQFRVTSCQLPVAQHQNTTRYTGFIAQEVEQAAKNVNFDFSGIDKPKQEVGNGQQATGNGQQVTDYYGLRYAEFVVPLVKAKQELAEKLTDLEKENAQQEALLKKYEAALESALLRLEVLESEKHKVVGSK